MGMDAMRERPDEARKSRRFGPSKAIVQAAAGQTEAQIVSVMKSLLGRPRASLREAANLAGVPDDARVTVAVIPRHGRRIIEIRAESDLIELRALLYRGLDDKAILEDDQIDVSEEFQRRGHGARLIGRQVEHAIRLGGNSRVRYSKRSDGRHRLLGLAAVWFRWKSTRGHPRSSPAGSRRSASSQRSHTDQRGTDAWWMENGDSMTVVLVLKPRSPNLRWFRDYLRRKGLP